jgi:uncharacterized caspase-like protein
VIPRHTPEVIDLNAIATGPRFALVIGNENYEQMPLPSSRYDADAMASVLRECGFEVILSINATHRQMREQIMVIAHGIDD